MCASVCDSTIDDHRKLLLSAARSQAVRNRQSLVLLSIQVSHIAMVMSTEQTKLFTAYYEKACAMNDDAKIVKLSAMMIQLLTDGGDAVEKWVHPKRMAVHPANRGGAKMQSLKMFQKGAKIVDVGFLLSLCGPDKAIAFSNNPKDDLIAKNHFNNTAGNEHFANFVVGDIEAGSSGCGHLNQFLAAIIDGATLTSGIDGTKLCEPGSNKLSRRVIVASQPTDELDKTLESGLKWTVIHHRIEEKYPRLPFIVQKALNTEHHIGEGADIDR